MLDFLLVLGQIPGTNFQITFNEIVVILLLAAVYKFRRQISTLVKTRSKKLLNAAKQPIKRNQRLSLSI